MRIILLIVSFLYISHLAGQDKFLVYPNPNRIEFELEGKENIAYGKVKNTSDHTLELLWKRNDVELPQGWVALVCDGNTCYSSSVKACPEDNPNVVAPKREFNLDVHVIDSGDVKDAHIVMKVYEKDDTSSQVNADYLFNKILSNKDVKNIYAKVYPNPAVDRFTVDFNTGLTRIELYNILGRKISSFTAVQNRSYDISEYPDGLYMLKLIGPNNQVLRTIRLQKRSVKA